MHLRLYTYVYLSDEVVKLCHSDFEIAIFARLQVFVLLLHHGVQLLDHALAASDDELCLLIRVELQVLVRLLFPDLARQ